MQFDYILILIIIIFNFKISISFIIINLVYWTIFSIFLKAKKLNLIIYKKV